MNGRSQNYWIERGKSGAIRARLTANAERIYSSLSSFPLSARVFLLSLLPSRQISSVTPLALSPSRSFLSTRSSEIIATPPIVSRWYTGLAQAQTRYLRYSKSITDKGIPSNPPVRHLQHFPTSYSLIAPYRYAVIFFYLFERGYKLTRRLIIPVAWFIQMYYYIRVTDNRFFSMIH